MNLCFLRAGRRTHSMLPPTPILLCHRPMFRWGLRVPLSCSPARIHVSTSLTFLYVNVP